MQSPECETSVPRPTHHDNSSSEIDAISLISANATLSETSYIDLGAVSNMALPAGNDQSIYENAPSGRPGVVDWVQKHSLHDESSKATTEPHDSRLNETPPHVDRTKQSCIQVSDDHVLNQEVCQPAKKVYDIPTLLRLKETQSAVPVMLRVKPEAIKENIFQYMGAATSRRLSMRSRDLSDITNISAGRSESHSHTGYASARPRYMSQPFRQPHAPPETLGLQRHDGFARFLKQHASPPHHRVTAGGRIVPAGPSSPPPMLDFGSLNGFVQDRSATAKSFQKDGHSSQSNARAQNPPAASSMTLGDYLRSQGSSADGMSFQHVSQSAPVQTSTPFNNVLFGYQPFTAPAPQTQAPVLPFAMFPDGSTLVCYNGVNYRASWNGTNMNLEQIPPIPPIPLPLEQQYNPQAYSQGQSSISQYGLNPQLSQYLAPSAPLASLTNFGQQDGSNFNALRQPDAKSDDASSLKAKLADLDKHLALYHYDITPANRASLITQRRHLVEEIDRIRLSKEKPKHSIPIIAPAAPGEPITPAAQSTSATDGVHEVIPNDQKAKGGTINKHLSPAAPTFIPRYASTIHPNSFGMRITSQQSNHQRFGIRAASAGIGSAPEAKGSVRSTTGINQSGNNVSQVNNQNGSRNEEASSSSVLDPSDPAMRVIEHEDIEYAARYLYNWTKDSKTYCTTVSEFQEAIRRVREQARLHGCAGGQSKDPAYDAEQDLWWAICDRDPIPLPSKVPDHVTNPRPWNWNDSAFNYRRRGANDAPGPECEQARNSPRILGWGPATTNTMKDLMDVSRSYYALKGRLPSVSFRDFAYDRDGNKRLIQSDTAASAAYAADSKFMTYSCQLPMEDPQRNDVGSSSGSGTQKEIKTSEFNIQCKHSVPYTKLELAAKLEAPKAASLSPEFPRTPEHNRFQQPIKASNYSAMQVSKPNSLSGIGITNSKKVETAHDTHHAYIEDYPDTPVIGGMDSASKGVQTPLTKITPSKDRMKEIPSASNGSPVQSTLLDRTVSPGTMSKLTDAEFQSIWYHTPLDEVTQKYLDDMKAYNPFQNKEDDKINHVTVAAKDRRLISDSPEPLTESKSSWGPDEGTMPTTCSDQNHVKALQTHTTVEELENAKTAKVKMPTASTLRAPFSSVNGRKPTSEFKANTLDSRELNAVNIPTAKNNESDNFLRKMLKSPHYSSAQPISVLSQITSSLADKISGTKQSPVRSIEKPSENKEDAFPSKHGNTGIIGNRSYANKYPPSQASLAVTMPNLAASKAQSSLASSTYQAHGYLPHFDGAGKAHTSSVYREKGIQPLPQVRLPSEDFYGNKEHIIHTPIDQNHGPSAHHTLTTYHNAVAFGYDGGRDSPPPKAPNTQTDGKSSRLAFDFMGVTPEDYENQRGDTNNAWHHGAVDDFFNNVREKELRIIASHQRANDKGFA